MDDDDRCIVVREIGTVCYSTERYGMGWTVNGDVAWAVRDGTVRHGAVRILPKKLCCFASWLLTLSLQRFHPFRSLPENDSPPSPGRMPRNYLGRDAYSKMKVVVKG